MNGLGHDVAEVPQIQVTNDDCLRRSKMQTREGDSQKHMHVPHVPHIAVQADPSAAAVRAGCRNYVLLKSYCSPAAASVIDRDDW
jgi:hypothetical protein